MKDVKKRHLEETAAKKLEDKRLKEESEQIKAEYEKHKSDWRKDLGEDFTNITTGNKVGQTFIHNPTGATFTTSGGLGGVESTPKTVTLDLGLDGFFTVDAPTYDQLALAGYAKPILMKRRDTEDVNPRLDASQEFAQKVNADVMMNARVDNRRGTAKISAKQKRINKAAETFIRYLTNKLPEGKWNDYMGKDYVKYAFEKGFLNDKGGITVGDNVIGSASSLTFDRKSGRYRMNFKGLGVDDNFTQFSKGDYNLWSKSVLNALGKYSADLQPAGLPWWLAPVQTAIGAGASKVYEFAKLFGGGNNVDAFIEIDANQLQKLNPSLVQQSGLVWSPSMMGTLKGSDPEVTHNYYAIYGKLPPYSVVAGSSPYNYGDHPEYDPKVIAKIDSMKGLSKTQTKEPQGTFDKDGNYIPPGYEDAIGTDEIKNNQGTFDKDGNYIPPGYEDAIGTDKIKNLGRPPFRGKVSKGAYDLSNTYSSGASEAEVKAGYEKARKGIPSLPPFSEIASDFELPDIPKEGWTYQQYMEMYSNIQKAAADRENPIGKEILRYGPGGDKTGQVPLSLVDAQEAIVIAVTKALDALTKKWEAYNKMPDLSGYGMDPSRDTETEPRPVRGGQGGRRLGSTTQRQGGAYNPSSIGFDRKETPFRNKKKNVRGSGARGGRKGRVNESNTLSKIKKILKEKK